jgi:hypothetical protein
MCLRTRKIDDGDGCGNTVDSLKGDVMDQERHDEETVIAAIRQHRGLLAPAAKMLGYNRASLYKYVARHNLQWVIDECREASLDWAENALFAQIEQGNVTAMIFFLKCIGKSRGYIERVPVRVTQEVEDAADTETDGEIITINVRNGTNGHHA